MKRFGVSPARWIGWGLVAPWFPSVGPGGSLFGLSPRSALSAAYTLPFAALVVVGVFAYRSVVYGRLGISRRLTLAELFLVLYVVSTFAAFLAGMLTGAATSASAGFVLQSLVPAVAFLAGAGLVRSADDPREELKLVVRGVSEAGIALGAVIAVATLVFGGDPAVGIVGNLGPFGLVKAKRFIPTMVATAICLRLLDGKRTATRMDRVLLPLAALSVFQAHSRFATLALLGLAGVFAYAALTTGRLRLRPQTIAMLCGALVVGFGAVTAHGVEGPTASLRAFDRILAPTVAEERSTELRVDAAASGLFEGLSTPFGRSFDTSVSESAGGFELGRNRVANSENGFTEVALRSGALGFVSLFGWVVAAFATVIRGRQLVGRGVPVVIAMFLFGAATVQTTFTELYTGPCMLFLLGGASALVTDAARRRVSESPVGTSARSAGPRRAASADSGGELV